MPPKVINAAIARVRGRNSCQKLLFLLFSINFIVLVSYVRRKQLAPFLSSNENNPVAMATLQQEVESRKDDLCREMFEIGWNFDDDDANFDAEVSHVIETLVMKKEWRNVGTEDYASFINFLPKTVSRDSNRLRLTNKTRLQMSGGRLRYLPCEIKQYQGPEIHECSVAFESERSHPFWIVFFGDSKMREKFYFMAKATDSVFNWTLKFLKDNTTQPFNGTSYTTLFSRKQSYEVSSHLGPKLTHLFSKHGVPDKQLYHWTNAGKEELLPDILVIELGAVIVAKYEIDNFESEDQIISAWWTLRSILKVLSKKMTIIITMHSRRRVVYRSNFSVFLTDEMFDILDTIVRTSVIGIQNTVLWDSTLPFNLASRVECDLLRDANHAALMAESEVYPSPLSRYRCKDIIHRSMPTLRDEVTFMLNYLCNRFNANQTSSHTCCL